jgi:hypothetical protein
MLKVGLMSLSFIACFPNIHYWGYLLPLQKSLYHKLYNWDVVRLKKKKKKKTHAHWEMKCMCQLGRGNVEFAKKVKAINRDWKSQTPSPTITHGFTAKKFVLQKKSKHRETEREGNKTRKRRVQMHCSLPFLDLS